MKTKSSVGIALCSVSPATGKAAIILVKKRLTYSYTSFVHGLYNPKNRAELIGMFGTMTVEEKRDILSLNFAQMWYRIWGHSTVSNSFVSAKNKFESNFLTNGATKLMALISASKTSTAADLWEIPKGRKKTKLEYDMNCAVREFQEETSIPKSQYKILPNAVRVLTHIDNDVKYENKYFIAVCSSEVMPKINMGHGAQIGEVSEARWVTLEEARVLDPTGKLAKNIGPILRYIKKHYGNII